MHPPYLTVVGLGHWTRLGSQPGRASRKDFVWSLDALVWPEGKRAPRSTVTVRYLLPGLASLRGQDGPGTEQRGVHGTRDVTAESREPRRIAELSADLHIAICLHTPGKEHHGWTETEISRCTGQCWRLHVPTLNQSSCLVSGSLFLSSVRQNGPRNLHPKEKFVSR